jgi:lipoprotein-releasing system permease protein
VMQGMLIGVIGTVVGLLLGYGVAFAGAKYHLITLSAEVYSIDYVPFAPRVTDGLLVAAVALLISFVATLYPSWSATRVVPAEALRYE